MEYDNTKMIEVTVFGTMRTKAGTDLDSVAYSGLKIKMPNCPPEYYKTHARRLFGITARENKSLKKLPFHGLITLDISDMEEIDGVPECVDKDIKEMTVLELQHLACCLKIREIQFPNKSSLKAMREKAYEMYNKVIKKKKVLKSGLDKKVQEEKIERKYSKDLARGDISPNELEDMKLKAINDCFNMIYDPNNPNQSYSFDKLKPLVPIKSKKAEKVEK